MDVGVLSENRRPSLKAPFCLNRVLDILKQIIADPCRFQTLYPLRTAFDPSRVIGRPISSRQEGRADANFADLFMPRAAQAVLWLL